MAQRYIYADKAGAGPEHPDKLWGLFSDELTVEQAQARYAADASRRDDWFGVVRMEAGGGRPSAYLQMGPRANGVELHKVNEHGSIEAAYTWGAYYEPSDAGPYQGNDERVFLSSITKYAYPEGDRFFRRSASIGRVSLTFAPDGYAKEERVLKRGVGEPSEVETREFRGVDVSANWTPIPEFGDWERFFHPESTE